MYKLEIQQGLKTEFGPDFELVKPLFLFRLPNLIALDIMELKVLKTRFDSGMELIRNGLVKLKKKLSERNLLGEQCLAEMEAELKEDLVKLRQELQNEPLCQFVIHTDDDHFFTDLYVGIVPHHFNWVLEKLHGTLPAETKQILETERANETENKPLVPYILILPSSKGQKWEPALTAPEWDPVPREPIPEVEEEQINVARKILDI